MPRARPPAVILAVDGASAAGKSTLVARASRALGWVPLAEAYDRLRPPVDLRFSTPARLRAIEIALLGEEARRWQAARALRAEGWTVLADTDFLGPLTYTAGLVRLGRAPPPLLRELLRRAGRLARAGRWGLPDGLVYLSTSARTRRARVRSDPDRHPPDLAARHEAVGVHEERFYRGAGDRALPGRLGWLDGERPVERLTVALARFARSITPRRGPDPAVGELLAALEREGADRPPRPRARRSATVKKPAPSSRAPRR
jgi:hypothetical protein